MTYTWVTLWFLLSAPFIVWDAAYVFLRPRSMVGGDLHWIWEPYAQYQNVYGTNALEENNGFPNTKALLNLVETAFGAAYIYLAHASNWPGAPLIGFATATMTLSKTVLYWLQEYFSGTCTIGPNALGDMLVLIAPGHWFVFPAMIVWRLGGDIIDGLYSTSRSAHKAASVKTQ